MEEEILKKLNTKFIGRKLKIFEEIDSTQKYIKRLDKIDSKNGLVVVSKHQTSGIGTNERKWYTKKDKNLTFSILLKPECNIKNIEGITILIAEVIVRVIKKMYKHDLKIKYPNDIILNGKKIGGILTESITNNEMVKQIIIGIGLNVNQEKFDKEIGNIATSLKKEFGNNFNKEEILIGILNEFEKEYMKLL